ncbi:MAG: hypothetical protein ACXVCP_16775 [Bdellovibrio sp.]
MKKVFKAAVAVFLSTTFASMAFAGGFCSMRKSDRLTVKSAAEQAVNTEVSKPNKSNKLGTAGAIGG